MFVTAFSDQWTKENKQFGFEVHNQRLGDLFFRLKHCRQRLQRFLNGEIDCLEELRDDILDYEGDTKMTGKSMYFNFISGMKQ